MTLNVYPNVKNSNENNSIDHQDPSVKTFRLNAITQMQRDLEGELEKYSRTKRKYSSVFNAISYVNAGTGIVSGGLSATAVGLLATGVGAPVAVPLGGVSIFLGLCTIASSAFNKKIKTKVQKHTAIVQLITAKLSSFRLIISKALQDSNITDEEFNRLQADYDDYKRQKFDLQKKQMSPPDTEALKKQCLEEVNKTLDSVLKK